MFKISKYCILIKIEGLGLNQKIECQIIFCSFSPSFFLLYNKNDRRRLKTLKMSRKVAKPQSFRKGKFLLSSLKFSFQLKADQPMAGKTAMT
jgi:hypothetical protein